MVRTVHDEPGSARFERAEHDGREHSAWALDAAIEPLADGSRLTMRLHSGGRLWMPRLDRLLGDALERSPPPPLACLSSGNAVAPSRGGPPTARRPRATIGL